MVTLLYAALAPAGLTASARSAHLLTVPGRETSATLADYIEVPQCAEFNIRYTHLGESCQNTLYFRRANGWGASDLSVVCAGLSTWWQQNILPLLSTQTIFHEVYGVDLSSQFGPTFTEAVTNSPGGPLVQDPMPGSVAMCVTFRTAGRGRSYRGRNFISGWTELNVSGNSFRQADADDVADAYTLLVAADYNIEADWVVVSRYTGGQPRTSGIYSPVIAATVRDLFVDSQRRRLAQRGR